MRNWPYRLNKIGIMSYGMSNQKIKDEKADKKK